MVTIKLGLIFTESKSENYGNSTSRVVMEVIEQKSFNRSQGQSNKVVLELKLKYSGVSAESVAI